MTVKILAKTRCDIFVLMALTLIIKVAVEFFEEVTNPDIDDKNGSH